MGDNLVYSCFDDDRTNPYNMDTEQIPSSIKDTSKGRAASGLSMKGKSS